MQNGTLRKLPHNYSSRLNLLLDIFSGCWMNDKILNGRTLTASIASDNGRAPEFIRRRVYKDKSWCYKCGEEGHLSYECPRKQLGSRERPIPKKGRREEERNLDGGDGDRLGFDDDNWASVVDGGAEERLMFLDRETDGGTTGLKDKGKKVKKASYFSDESDDDY